VSPPALPADLDPAWQDLAFMAPLSDTRAAQLVDFVAGALPAGGGLVVDAGCGWAELLQRVLAAAPAARGLGLDTQDAALAHGRALARHRGLDGRLRLETADARHALPARADALLCIGASQIWGPPVTAAQPLAYAAALAALRAPLAPGAPLVYGEGIWSAPPTPAATAVLSGRPDEFVDLPTLLGLVRDAGFAVVQVHEANADEWDRFESGYTARFARWLARHPADHPGAAAVRERLQRQSDAYHRGYRGVLGLAYLGLLAV